MTTVADLINDARNYAIDVTASASASLGSAYNALEAMRAGYIPPGIPPGIPIDPPPPISPGNFPAYKGAKFERQGTPPNKPALGSVRALDLGNEPTPPQANEYLTFEPVEKPSQAPGDESLLANPPAPAAIDLPPDPHLMEAIAAIPVPVITPVIIPPAPGWREPEFLGVRPDAPPDAPEDLDAVFRTQYDTIAPVFRDAVTTELDSFLDREFPQHRTNMALIEDRLATYLAGGTALSPAVEDAIYNRTLDKTNADARRAAASAWEKAAQMGHTLVSPSLIATQVGLDQTRRDNNARAAIDIAIKQAELEQANLQFAVTTSTTLRKVALDSGLAYYTGLININEQAMVYARSVVEQLVKTYELAIRYTEVKARLYEADADIYKARLEGSLAEIRAYEALVRGLEAQTRVDVAQVQVYEARIAAVSAQANVYRSLIEASNAQASIERTKGEIYGERVRAYGSQVNAFVARWQGYNHAVQGETAKMQANAEISRAYAAEVAGYEAATRAKAAAVQADESTNLAMMKTFSAEVEAYSVQNKVEADVVASEIESFKAELAAWTANVDAHAKQSQAFIARYEAILRGIAITAQLYLEELRGRNAVELARANGISTVATAGAQIYAGTAQAALSGINTLAAQITSA